MLKSLDKWLDIGGNPIHAHGGCLLRHKGIWYWYGEYKSGQTQSVPIINSDGNHNNMFRIDFIGISCYSSTNLIDWEFKGLVLEASSDEFCDLHTSRVIERPKVIYNEKIDKFVMILHVDNFNYSYASIGVAVCNEPYGKFEYLHSFRPNCCDSRDMTVFVDDDSKAYLFYSSDNNRTMHVTKLCEDYLHCETSHTAIFNNCSREAPAVFKKDNRYYCITSGCSGWAPNEAAWAYSDEIMGEWELMGNPCIGENANQTFGCQPTFAFSYNGRCFMMLDKWIPFDLQDSRYLWLEVKFDDESPFIEWSDYFEKKQIAMADQELRLIDNSCVI